MGPAAGVPDARGASVGFGFGFGLVSVMRVLPCATVGRTAASPPRDTWSPRDDEVSRR